MSDEKSSQADAGHTPDKSQDNNEKHNSSRKDSEQQQRGDDGKNGQAEKDTGAQNGIVAAVDKVTEKKEKAKDKVNPPGGKDETPIPDAPDGYTVRFIIHRAENLPVADLKQRSTDPYLTATLTSPGIQKRHKEDPDMVLRTKTIHKSTNPEWNQEWIVANVPSSGFRLKCRLYDEDEADHDDRLGNVTIYAKGIGKSWRGIHEECYDIKKRMASKRAYLLKGCMSMLSNRIDMNGRLYLSAEVLGESDPPHGRMYTLGPCMWTKHYSPMIGRLTGTKNPEDSKKGKTEKYDFQANQFQLQGPVPPGLYHRYVEFKPFVKGMFSKTGLRGRILNKALHHQHRHIYNYSPSTEYGTVKAKSEEASKQFLKMVHYDEGGRIFTYVITLDGLVRFTETGKEFGIDLLSKHTMHSDVNLYIACSGEFFIRRLSKPDKDAEAPDQHTHPEEDIPGGPPNEKPPRDPKYYELIIDNDSGTYRPEADLLGELKKFLKANFPGLHIVVKECTDKELDKMKNEQRRIKKDEGEPVELIQNSDGEVSSSDEEALDAHSKNLRGEKRHRSTKQKAYQALEDPRGALKDKIPGERGREDREERETRDDMAGEGPSSSC